MCLRKKAKKGGGGKRREGGKGRWKDRKKTEEKKSHSISRGGVLTSAFKFYQLALAQEFFLAALCFLSQMVGESLTVDFLALLSYFLSPQLI